MSSLEGGRALRRGLPALCAVVFVDLLGFTLVLPGMPLFARGLGASGAGVGVTMAAYSLAQFATGPLIGALSDRWGRRNVLLVSLSGSVISMALLAFVPSLGWLIAARAVAGAFGGSIGTAQAFAADLAGSQQRARAMGAIGAAIGLAFVVGPAAGAALGRLPFGVSAGTGAVLAAVNLGVAVRWLPWRGAAASGGDPPAVSGAGLWRRGGPLRNPVTAPVLTGTLLTMGAFAAMEATLALVVRARAGGGTATVGVILTAAGAVMVATQLRLIGPAVARLGERRTATAGAALIGIGAMLLPFLPLAGTGAAACVMAVGEGLFTPATASLLTRAVPARQRGAVLGTMQSAASLARILGPAAGGALFDVGISAPYMLAAAAAAIAAAGLAVTPGRLPSDGTPPIPAGRAGQG